MKMETVEPRSKIFLILQNQWGERGEIVKKKMKKIKIYKIYLNKIIIITEMENKNTKYLIKINKLK